MPVVPVPPGTKTEENEVKETEGSGTSNADVCWDLRGHVSVAALETRLGVKAGAVAALESVSSCLREGQ